MREIVNGILLLDKPLNLSSNHALQKAKRLFNAQKAGHTGSLDPLATGMLPICFGEATKFSQFLLDADKVYEVTAYLGAQTTTGDSEGEIIATCDMKHLTGAQITTACQSFLGESKQVPPMYSALKHQGKPLYELARRGIKVDRPARTITIFSLSIESFSYPTLKLRVHCSKGTYIRTLVEDIAKSLNGIAYVSQLHRVYTSPYQNATMYSLETLIAIHERMGVAALHACLLPVDTAVQSFPTLELSSAATYHIRSGQAICASSHFATSLLRLTTEDGTFLGLGETLPDGRIKAFRLLANSPH